MNTATRYLSLKVWTLTELAAAVIPCLFILSLPSIWSVFSWPGAIAGIAGALALRHFALHGCTLLRGTAPQRLVLASIWIGTVAIFGAVATVLDAV